MQRFTRRTLRSIFLTVVLSSGASIYTANWGPGAAFDVTNDDINILGDVTVNTPVTVSANDGGSYSINVLGDRVISGSSHLLFNVSGGSTITLRILNNLRFQGTSGNQDLLVTVCCDTDSDLFSMVLSNGKSVRLAGAVGPADLGGVKFLTVMQSATGNSPCFAVSRDTGLSDSQVVIGARSMMTFISREAFSASASTFGTMQVDAANNSTGRMILRIQEDGSFVIGGHLFSGDCYAPSFSLSDVDFTTEGGAPSGAKLDVINSGGSAGRFVVINENNELSALIADPFCNNKFATSDGIRRGFVLAGNGYLELADNTYIDYIGLAINNCPSKCGLCDVSPEVKDRNGSAFIVDGTKVEDAYGDQFCAIVDLIGSSAIYFRSGVDVAGNFIDPDFLVDPAKRTPAEGNIVFTVEGCLDVLGASRATNAFHILSTEVLPTGGSVTIDGAETTFPLRTFGLNPDGSFKQYNSASFFINNDLNFNTVSLVHTDLNHKVNAKDDVDSEPSYVGGETFIIKKSSKRPCINLYNSMVRVHADAAATGVDWCTPNDADNANQSNITFYHNGFCKDLGSGRNLILGTRLGAFGCDKVSIVNNDSHLDIMQRTAQDIANPHQLALRTAPNDATICQGIAGDISTQFSMHCIYLGNSSNVSVGTQTDMGTDDDGNSFALTTMPTLSIEGNFIAFESRGGPENQPEASGTTGRGAIFVDNNGTFELSCPIRSYFGSMVIQSGTGSLDLPRSQIQFDNRVGISQWRTDLSDSSERVIIASGQKTPEYVLDWKGVQKDCINFIPYEVDVCSICSSPAVIADNITAIPCVEGTVDQLQVKHSQMGNRAHLKIDGGFVRELIFLDGTTCGEVAGGVVVLENSGCVGLGNANTTQDSLEGIVKLGGNGVTLIANGPGFVQLNNNLTIDGLCHILTGPDFGDGSKLVFRSDVPREIRVKSCGVLDLSSFNAGDIFELDGFVRLVFEPGAKLILGGGTINAEGKSAILFRQVKDQTPATGSDLTSTDEFRVRLIGTGILNLEEDATMFVNRGTFVGVETLSECPGNTDLTINIRDRASFKIGDDATFGGAFQVGNTLPSVYGNTVSFKLFIDGIEAEFEVNSEGFFGTGVGIVDKKELAAPNSWLVGSLFDVDVIDFDLDQGYFKHQRILPGSDFNASLIALGPAATGYNFDIVSFPAGQVRFLGGGNVIQLPSGIMSIAPSVGTLDGAQGGGFLAGLLSSGPMLNDDSKNFPVVLPFVGVAPATLFSFWKVDSVPGVTVAGVQQTPQAAITSNTLGNSTIGYIFGTTIVRTSDFEVLGNGGDVIDDQRSKVVGAVGIAVNDLGVITSVQNFNV